MVGAIIKAPSNRPTIINRIKSLRKWVMQGLSKKPIIVRRFKRFLLSNLPGTQTQRLRAGRTYIANRTRGKFISAMQKYNEAAKSEARCVELLEKLRATINSYLGMMVHHKSYKVRRRICEMYILPKWGKYIYFVEDFSKCVIRNQYDKQHLIRRRLKSRKYAAKFIRPKWNGD